MKVFFKQEILSEKTPRHFLSEWIKPLFPEPRHSLYGLDPLDLEYSQQQSNADAFVLPFTWNYYFDKKKVHIIENGSKRIIKGSPYPFLKKLIDNFSQI